MIIALRLFIALVIYIAATITLSLIRSKDGVLRKILIAYFCDEILSWGIVLGASIIWDFTSLIIKILLMILIPKALVKIWFYFFISKKGENEKLN